MSVSRSTGALRVRLVSGSILEIEGLIQASPGFLGSDQGFAPSPSDHVWDAALPPADRDWIADQPPEECIYYFNSLESALRAEVELKRQFAGLESECTRVEEQDWNAQWKAQFKGVSLSPYWEIVPPWLAPPQALLRDGQTERHTLILEPGMGFGTGTHETTQLCLMRLGELAQSGHLKDRGVLDFGSGSGILSIASALMGARVDAVEIDPDARANAQTNAHLNRLEARSIQQFERIPESKTYDFVVANILRPVLLAHADALVSACAGKGELILSGLIESDLAQITERFESALRLLGRHPQCKEVRSLGEWRLVRWYPS